MWSFTAEIFIITGTLQRSSKEVVVFTCNPKVLTTRSSEILKRPIRFKSSIKIQSNKHNAVQLETHRLQVVASTFSSESAGHGSSYHYKGIEMPQLPRIDEAASSSPQTEAVQPEDLHFVVLLVLLFFQVIIFVDSTFKDLFQSLCWIEF